MNLTYWISLSVAQTCGCKHFQAVLGRWHRLKTRVGRHLEVQKKVWILRQRGPMQALCDCHCMRAARISHFVPCSETLTCSGVVRQLEQAIGPQTHDVPVRSSQSPPKISAVQGGNSDVASHSICEFLNFYTPLNPAQRKGEKQKH